jgi:hypothetical protein
VKTFCAFECATSLELTRCVGGGTRSDEHGDCLSLIFKPDVGISFRALPELGEGVMKCDLTSESGTCLENKIETTFTSLVKVRVVKSLPSFFTVSFMIVILRKVSIIASLQNTGGVVNRELPCLYNTICS